MNGTIGQGAQYQNHYGAYRAESDRLWRIRWLQGGASDGWQADADGWTENGYWDVTLRDGTRYLLGTTRDSRQAAYALIGGNSPGNPVTRMTVRWRVKQIVYPNNVTVNYSYEEDTYAEQCDILNISTSQCNRTDPPGEDHANHERASYLKEINYAGVRVVFHWDRRWNGNGPANDSFNDGRGAQVYRSDFADAGLLVVFWQTDALQKITLERSLPDGSANPWKLVREWRFVYGTDVPQDEPNKRLRTLVNFIASAPKPPEQGGGMSDLPAFVFNYTSYLNKESKAGSDWEQAQFYYPRLTRIQNGYGGEITASYTTPDTTTGCNCSAGNDQRSKNYRVQERTVKNQGAGATAWKEEYNYGNDIYR